MDPVASRMTEIVNECIQLGLFVGVSTAGAGLALGPLGLAIGAASGGAAYSALQVFENPIFRRIALMLMTAFPLVSSQMFREFLMNLANMVANLLRRCGILPASTQYQPLQQGPRPPPPGF